MSDICADNQFELIEKYKKELIESTNIETSQDEMTVLDDLLFRFWQMGWLDRLEQTERSKDGGVNMDDLISREKLKRKFCGHCEDYGKCEKECFDLRIINSMPTAEKRKRGKWVEVYLEGQLLASRCTACGELETGVPLNYCPWCGARMTEESDG